MKYKCVGILVFLLTSVAAASPAAAQGDLHGSIVFSQEANGGYAWGMAWNHGSGMSATRDAYAECQGAGGSSCSEVGEFVNACGALAIGENNGYGAGWGDSITAAENDALAQCRAANSNCRLEASQCAKDAATFASSDPEASAVTDETTREPVASPAAAQGDLHGSIVFSQEADGGYAWGMAWNHGSGMSATRDAYAECQGAGGSSCSEVGEFVNACGALAIGENNGYGAGWGDSITEAENDALAQCRAANSNCRLEASQCAKDAATFASSAPEASDVPDEVTRPRSSSWPA